MRKLFVLIAAVALLASFTLPAMAADKEVSFYGRVWMDTFIESYSKEARGYPNDDQDLLWNLEGNGTSRFGANFKWDSMSANVEIRPNSASVYRQWWGAWNFGAGTLLIGHTWSPLYINATICSQCEAGGSGGQLGGWVGDLRRAQVRLTFGGLTVALVEPSTSRVVDTTATPATEIDTMLPKLEATYALNVGPVALVPFLGWQTYDEVIIATDKDYGIDGYVIGLTAKFPIGPGYVNGQFWMSQNDANWGNLYNNGFGGAVYNAGTDSIEDEDGMGYAVEAGMTLTDTMSFAVGYGYNKYERDFGAAGAGDYEDDSNIIYGQLSIQIAPGFWVVPEIGFIDYGDQKTPTGTTEEGDLTYYGAVWKIHF